MNYVISDFDLHSIRCTLVEAQDAIIRRSKFTSDWALEHINESLEVIDRMRVKDN